MKLKFGLAILLLILVPPARAQGAPAINASGSPHGVTLTWTASTTTGVQYYIWRCPGTCTASSSSWTMIQQVGGTNYLDPSSGLSVTTTYSYAAQAVAGSNQSAFSNIATVTTPTTWPTNPNAASGLTAGIQ